MFHGVTSVIDLDFDPVRSAWDPVAPHAPHIYHCGRGVRVAGGYGPAFVAEEIAYRVFPNVVYDPEARDH
jgi:hypothetical protein